MISYLEVISLSFTQGVSHGKKRKAKKILCNEWTPNLPKGATVVTKIDINYYSLYYFMLCRNLCSLLSNILCSA